MKRNSPFDIVRVCSNVFVIETTGRIHEPLAILSSRGAGTTGHIYGHQLVYRKIQRGCHANPKEIPATLSDGNRWSGSCSLLSCKQSRDGWMNACALFLSLSLRQFILILVFCLCFCLCFFFLPVCDSVSYAMPPAA